MNDEVRDAITEAVDYHVNLDVEKDGDCGCSSVKQAYWQMRSRHIGMQAAYSEHVTEVMVSIMEGNIQWR